MPSRCAKHPNATLWLSSEHIGPLHGGLVLSGTNATRALLVGAMTDAAYAFARMLQLIELRTLRKGCIHVHIYAAIRLNPGLPHITR